MVTFKRNEMRTFPTKQEILNTKTINDLIYGFLQINSLLTEDKRRYCIKSEVTSGKIIKYYQENNKQCPFSDSTIKRVLKLFCSDECGLTKEGTVGSKKVLFLPDLEAGKYVFIKTNTLRYLVNTANSNVIKVYAFLKMKQQQHDDFNYKEPYRFSKAKLLEVIGYNSTNKDNYVMIKDILDCLQNNGLIVFHQEYKQTNGGQIAPYLILDKVNDDYITNFTPKQKQKEDSFIAVPAEDLSEKPKSEPKFVF